VQAEAALRVAGGVEDSGVDAGDAEDFVVGGGVVRGLDGGDFEVEPGGLGGHEIDERNVVLAVEDGRAGDLLEGERAGDVVDVGVGYEDLADGELVLVEEGEDAGDVVAGIDDDGLTRGFVAEDGAVALQEADGEGFADHVGGLLSIESKAKAQADGLRFEFRRTYFFAGVDWLEGVSESTERLVLLVCDMTMVRAMEVTMKMMADQVVSLERMFVAPRGPKAVCEP